jgi:hypothetical protein
MQDAAMRIPLVAAVILLTGGAAFAAQNCDEQLSDVSKAFRGVLSSPSDQRIEGKGNGHRHVSAEVRYMRKQIGLAAQLCKEGNEHEAMLRMDVVRAWLRLPEVEHPPEHGYIPPAKK